MMAVEMHQTPMVNEPTVVEDLETGDIFHHPPEGPMASMASMDQTYQDAILNASKARRSKGVKRLLSLHHAIESKKASCWHESIQAEVVIQSSAAAACCSPTVEVNQKVW